MDKETCDHCDTTKVDEHDTDYRITWCAECVKQDYQILNQLSLVDSNGYPLGAFIKNDCLFNFGDQNNIAKLKQVPKRGQTALTIIGIDLEVQPESTEPPPVPSQGQLDSDWFARYNSLDSLPGRRP